MTTKTARPQVVLMCSLRSRFERETALGIATYARQHTDWQLHAEHNPQLTETDVKRVRPAGIMAMSNYQGIEEFADEHRIPFVLIGTPPHLDSTSAVSVDERGISRMAVDYLSDLGLKHFAYVGHAYWPFVIERRDHFIEAVEERDLGPPALYIGKMYDRRQRSRFMRNLEAFLLSLPRPCGILAANDALGTEVIEMCQNVGLRVPDDIAVLGVDDDELTCELSKIPLTSIIQPFLAIGYEGARLLHEQITRKRLGRKQMFLQPLRVRARASSDLIAIDDPDVAAALRLIHDNLAEPINVDWVVKKLSVARRSIERNFKKHVGRTILDQIHYVRFKRARELLAESDLSLETVARRSGFANARWMADSFRRELHTTPRELRRRFRIES